MDEISLQILDVRAPEIETAADGLDVRIQPALDNVDPVTGALIIAGVLAAGKLVIRLWREFRGGTVVDLTKTPVDVSRDRDLDYGFILIVAKDGSVTIEAKDEPKDSLERMVSGALELATKATVGGVKAVVDKTLGVGAKTTTTTA